MKISIHAPLTGRDDISDIPQAHYKISIHAPLTGRDPRLAELSGLCYDFNPRAPYGARQQKCTNDILHFCNNRQLK